MIVISSLMRPHIFEHAKCWCKPEVHEHDGEQHVCHRFLEPMPDNQERMSCYSEQIPFRPEWRVAFPRGTCP